ncbi:MAG TPA: hypothetical protein VFA45_01570 [Actinomycetes bacterium]|nr:hypothetical protein [Actinomycetes bacterium]
MNSTAERRRAGLPAAAARVWTVPARRPGITRQAGAVLFRYLAIAFILLAILAVANPHRSGAAEGTASRAWDYQRESIDIEGRGLLNIYARQTMHATAWLAKSSIERQRDVYRLNLLNFLVGDSTAGRLIAWRGEHRLALEAGTEVLLVALVGYGVVRRPSRRTWLLALLLLLAGTVLVTKPQASMRAAAAPGVGIPNAMLDVVATVAPSQRLRAGASPEQTLRQLADQYWTSFVAHPLSRVETGSAVLTTAPPTRKSSVLGALRKSVSSVNDWAIGRHGPERTFIATSALGYVVPFAVVLGVLAMLATCAQALLFLLCIAGPFMLPFAVEGPTRRGALVRYWLLPMLGCAALLGLTSLGSFAVMRLAEALHRSDEYVGVLLAGSTWPFIAALVLLRRGVRRRRSLMPWGGIPTRGADRDER